MKNASPRRIAVPLLLIASVAFVPQSRARQSPDAVRQARTLAAIVYEGNMAGLLGHLAEEFGVNIGLETDPREPQPAVKINLHEAKLRDVLDAVVQSQPAYRWRQEGDFIDVFPVKGGSPLLDASVASFQVNAASWLEASEALLKLPDVQSAASAMRLSRTESERGSTGPRGAAFSVYLENVPVRRALHEITKRSGSHFWVFRQYGEGRKTFTLGASGAPRS